MSTEAGMRWDWAGQTGVRFTLAEQPAPKVSDGLLDLQNHLESALQTGLCDVVVAYTTLTAFFDPTCCSREEVVTSALEWHRQLADRGVAGGGNSPARHITLPVWYAPEAGADLLPLAATLGMAPETLIALHSGCEYRAYANGFAPGFCYLGQIPEAIAAPRLDTPRRSVPAGSVAIADRQTAVYPSASPGGWRLLGRCPLTLFDLANTPPNRIRVGDRVRFEAINRETYLSLGGAL